MITEAGHGTMTCETAPLVMWRGAVDGLARLEVDEIDRIVGRDRLARWYRDGMTASMAAASVRSWVTAARPGIKADRETSYLREMLCRSKSR